MTGIGQNVQNFRGFFVFFSEFQGISCFPIEKYLVLRSYIMKKIVPHNIEEMSGNSICQESPGKHPGKVHLLTFWVKEACFRIKGASLEKNFFSKSCGDF